MSVPKTDVGCAADVHFVFVVRLARVAKASPDLSTSHFASLYSFAFRLARVATMTEIEGKSV